MNRLFTFLAILSLSSCKEEPVSYKDPSSYLVGYWRLYQIEHPLPYPAMEITDSVYLHLNPDLTFEVDSSLIDYFSFYLGSWTAWSEVPNQYPLYLTLEDSVNIAVELIWGHHLSLVKNETKLRFRKLDNFTISSPTSQ